MKKPGSDRNVAMETPINDWKYKIGTFSAFMC